VDRLGGVCLTNHLRPSIDAIGSEHQGHWSGQRCDAVERIGRIGDFADPRKLAAYLGLVPRVQNSNQRSAPGASPNRATSSPAQRWWSVLWWRNAIARSYSSSLSASSADAAETKPNIALPRKFLGVIYHTLKKAGCAAIKARLLRAKKILREALS
jgi:hypothetical protein